MTGTPCSNPDNGMKKSTITISWKNPFSFQWCPSEPANKRLVSAMLQIPWQRAAATMAMDADFGAPTGINPRGQVNATARRREVRLFNREAGAIRNHASLS
jgi:hypothetical protein